MTPRPSRTELISSVHSCFDAIIRLQAVRFVRRGGVACVGSCGVEFWKVCGSEKRVSLQSRRARDHFISSKSMGFDGIVFISSFLRTSSHFSPNISHCVAQRKTRAQGGAIALGARVNTIITFFLASATKTTEKAPQTPQS